MNQDVINLLNLASSKDSDLMLPASQQLTRITESGDLSNQVYLAIAAAVFSGSQTDLSNEGRLVGLIYLKNAMFDGKIWQSIDESVRRDIEVHLFFYLSEGCEKSSFCNKRDIERPVGLIVNELVSRYVKNEWLKPGWSDLFWENLVEWCAWASLRAALKAAGSFRLPLRRRAFDSLVRNLIPKVMDTWQIATANMPVMHIPAVYLTKLLQTCFVLSDVYEKTSDCNAASLMSSVLSISFKTLEQINGYASDANLSEQCFRLSRRLTKLVLACFSAFNAEVRCEFVDYIANSSLHFISHHKCDLLDYRSVKWILSLLYFIFYSYSESNAVCAIHTNKGTQKLQTWMVTFQQNLSGENVNNNWTSLIILLLEKWFLLSKSEITALTEDPEGCLSSGGASQIEQFSSLSSSEWYANMNSIWNPDTQANELLKSDVNLVLGTMDSYGQILVYNACRQLTELLFTLFFRAYKNQSNAVFYQIVQTTNFDKPVIFEALLRLLQLCLPYFGDEPNWILLTDYLILNGLKLVDNLPNNLNETISENQINLIILLTRILCVISRRAALCNSLDCNNQSNLEIECSKAVELIIQYLALPYNENQSSRLNKCYLCIRLACIHSLDWLIDQPLLPANVITPRLEILINHILLLMQHVQECETRIYLLKVLRNLVQSSDLIEYPRLTAPILNAMHHLWQLGSQSAAFRASVLDTVCLLVTSLNASRENDCEFVELTKSLQKPISDLIKIALNPLNVNELSGSEALFEPGLRLWTSMVEGEGSVWTIYLLDLIPLLFNSQSDQVKIDGDLTCKSLFNRIDSAEQAQVRYLLIFRIIQGLLRLAHKNDASTIQIFVQYWSESFWFTSLQINLDWTGNGDQVNLENLYSQAAIAIGDDENRTDQESVYRLDQLRLFTIWFTIYLDLINSNELHSALNSNFTISSNLFGLLIMYGQSCLMHAPVESHSDICPRATELRLGILARLALYPNLWSVLLGLLEIITKIGSQNWIPDLSRIYNEFITISNRSVDNLLCDYNPDNLATLLSIPMERWLKRADSYSCYMDRRCIAMGCLSLLCLWTKILTKRFQAFDINQLNGIIAEDKFYSHWLEPVVNLLIQVLCDEERLSTDENLIFYRSYPKHLTTLPGLKQSVRIQLNELQTNLGNSHLVTALFQSHIDSALQKQLEEQLNV